MQDPDWFILTVRPGMERAAVAAVSRFGWDAFLPGYLKTVLKHSHQRGGKKNGQREQRLFPSWPGYLWVGADKRRQGSKTQGWEKILELEIVTGVISVWREAEPGRWERHPLKLPRVWRAWRELRDVEDIAFREALQGEAPPVDYTPGDEVLITNKVFFQFRAKCVFLDAEGRTARVILQMLGSQREVTIAADEAMRHDDSASARSHSGPLDGAGRRSA